MNFNKNLTGGGNIKKGVPPTATNYWGLASINNAVRIKAIMGNTTLEPELSASWSQNLQINGDTQGNEIKKLGYSVAVSGNRVVVGAPDSYDGSGAVFVYTTPDGGITWDNGIELSVPSRDEPLNWAPTDAAFLERYPYGVVQPNPAGDRFGFSVATDGDIIIVGAPYAYSQNYWTFTQGPPPPQGLQVEGAVYFFDYNYNINQWTASVPPRINVVPNSWGASSITNWENSEFGYSVAISTMDPITYPDEGGDVIMIGAPSYGNGQTGTHGKVIIYQRCNISVNLNSPETWAFLANTPYNSGAAMGLQNIFKDGSPDLLNEAQTTIPPTPGGTFPDGLRFGHSIALPKNAAAAPPPPPSYNTKKYAVVGAPNYVGTDGFGLLFKGGVAFIYNSTAGFNCWSGSSFFSFLGSGSLIDASYGFSVAVSDDDKVLVGYPNSNNNKGSTFVINKPGIGWPQSGTNPGLYTAIQPNNILVGNDSNPGDKFGFSVAIDNNNIIIGSPFNNSTGSIYIFNYLSNGNTWNQLTKVVGNDTATSDEFGTAVAVNNNIIVAGAPIHNSPYGAFYIFINN